MGRVNMVVGMLAVTLLSAGLSLLAGSNSQVTDSMWIHDFAVPAYSLQLTQYITGVWWWPDTLGLQLVVHRLISVIPMVTPYAS